MSFAVIDKKNLVHSPNICAVRGSNALRGTDCEFWLAQELAKPVMARALIQTLGTGASSKLSQASVHGTEGGKADLRIRVVDDGKVHLARISVKLRTEGAGGPAWSNQVCRHSAERASALGLAPPAEHLGHAALGTWLRGEAHTAAGDASMAALIEHWTSSWTRLASSCIFGEKPRVDVLCLVLARRDKGWCKAQHVAMVGPTVFSQLLMQAGEPVFDAQAGLFGNPILAFQRKGGDNGADGANDFQAKLNSERLAELLAML